LKSNFAVEKKFRILYILLHHIAASLSLPPVENIWNKPGGQLAILRNILIQKEYCVGCFKKDICGGGCRARAINLHSGNLRAPDIPSCIFHEVAKNDT